MSCVKEWKSVESVRRRKQVLHTNTNTNESDIFFMVCFGSLAESKAPAPKLAFVRPATTHPDTYTQTDTHIHTYVCMFTCIYFYLYIHTYIYAHICILTPPFARISSILSTNLNIFVAWFLWQTKNKALLEWMRSKAQLNTHLHRSTYKTVFSSVVFVCSFICVGVSPALLPSRFHTLLVRLLSIVGHKCIHMTAFACIKARLPVWVSTSKNKESRRE